jgi:hypothetical protein
MKRIVCSLWNTSADFSLRECGGIQLHKLAAAFLLNNGRRQDLLNVVDWWDHFADIEEAHSEKCDRS